MAGTDPGQSGGGDAMTLRIGQGIDAHQLATGRRLLLGGVEIPFEQGLAAHSDGDVLLHAITDAILGAMGAGDLGRHFPDSDAAWRDADSRDLLRQVVTWLHEQGGRMVNVDATIIAQRPRLEPYIETMRRNVATDLASADEAVNIKATTMEWMGFTGRGEGVAATAVVLAEWPSRPADSA